MTAVSSTLTPINTVYPDYLYFAVYMNRLRIEFHNPAGSVNEWVIHDIEQKLMEFHRRDNEISGVQVFFRTRPVAFDGDYICAMEATIFGSSIMVERNAESYQAAAGLVLEELGMKIDEQVQRQKRNEPPDEIYSSVRV